MGNPYIDMRIRKRSAASFTSSSSWERRTRSPTSCVAVNTDNGNGDGEEAEFLLPLVAAAMDFQRSEEEEKVEGDGDHCTRATALARPVHNWRNALQLQRGGDGNSENQALKDDGEGKKVECKWKGNMRNQWESIRLLRKEGTQGTLLKREDTSSSTEKEITGDTDEEWELPKSGLLDRGNLGRHEKKSSVHSDKGKRSKDEIGYFKGWKNDETKTAKKLKQEIQLEDGRRVDEKAMPNKRSNNNEAEGSQCRRRNGRGWRCSQRTLVGYSLCEHHLAKGRLRNINSNANNNAIGTGIVINKVSNCKIKELRLINTSCSRSAEAELTNKL